MDTPPRNLFSDLVGLVKSWLPWRPEPPHLSRDFWMPDESCRVCYECDTQFTIINRRHHCRLCGRVFCGKCASNSVPSTSGNPRTPHEEGERIRVCNYCFKQWQHGITATANNGVQASNLDVNTSSSPSAGSFISTKSSCIANSSVGSYSGPPYQRVVQSSAISINQSSVVEMNPEKQHEASTSRTSTDLVADIGDPSPHPYEFSFNRSDDEEDEYGLFRTDSDAMHSPQVNGYFSQVDFKEMGYDGESHSEIEDMNAKCVSSSPLDHNLGLEHLGTKDENDTFYECEAPTSSYAVQDVETEPVDFENNGVLWLPPEPEDEEDDKEADLFDDDDDDGDATGEWGYLRSAGSFGSGEHRNRDKSSEEHKSVMKNVVDGHFRALVAQLLQVENLLVGDEYDEESWLEIITTLSWEAATLLKPDTSTGGGMDPGGYVKVKCIASGNRCDSMVVKGVVCKKNVAHRRMATKMEKPRLLILGGALEYQRVSNLLSSFDTLLQQEMDHLKMAVAKIDAHHPDLLLVEKSVSRYAQEYLLARDISLVLNIKKPLLERIARCTGAQIVPSIDHLSTQKIGHCEKFHVERVTEDLGSAGQSGKKLVKTLMYFEGCPKPLGCTILLRGANGDELKKVKHVVQYGEDSGKYVIAETCKANDDHLDGNGFGPVEDLRQTNNSQNDHNEIVSNQQQETKQLDDRGPLKEEFPPSPSDHQSILVSLSSRCVWKGTVCERAHLFRIKYYGSFDKPLGRFLRDHLFDQSYRCCSCDMPSEAHVHCYTHRQGTLTISVKKFPEVLLTGEREGKIWMWHRCLKCPRTNGFPPATRRIVMSDAAWGLSFGKFLELSFSNHAAASRVASCGHSLHRDCLRFYGFGKMVACFRYASIDVHSVFLPPAKIDFNFENQEWVQQETDEVVNRAELLFSEVLNALSQISERTVGTSNCLKTPELRHQIAELEEMLQKEKVEFEESLQKVLNKEVRKGHTVTDILEINRLRRQLLFQSYMWDHRLVYAAGLEKSIQNGIMENQERHLATGEKLSGTNSTPISGTNGSPMLNEGPSGKLSDPGAEIGQNEKEDPTLPIIDQCDPVLNIRRTLSEGQIPFMENLSDTLDAAWTGENHPIVITKDSSIALSDSAVAVVTEGLELKDHADEQKIVTSVSVSLSPALSTRGSENIEDSVSWLGMPFLNFYRSLNKSFLPSAQKFDTLGEYNPVYVSSFRDLELGAGARLLLPVGVNDVVIPVYDDEPTSIIAYALASAEYHVQLNDEGERLKDSGGDLMPSLSITDSLHFQSFHSYDESGIDHSKSFGSTEESSFLPLSGSRSSLLLDPLSFTTTLHARVSFGDDGPVGKDKYSVTCYYAKRFETLRRMCCPSELDYIRSLSRCKKWGAQGGKSNVFFAKTLDDRFIIKQVTKTELESFIKFAPGYFKYLSESIGTGSPTCLAKIVGIYQVLAKHGKGGKESKMDVLVMENLLYKRNVTRLYDLKGSSRSRYNADSSGSNKVLLDQNLIEAMPTSPIFVGNKAKRLLERAVWNDTSFLASVDVMDYSLLVGVDGEKNQLVIGIIDFMRQYTWDKHLETWVKASGILGGPKNASPTVISPKQYKKRFRKAMTTYFLMVPDQWSPRTIVPSTSQSDLCEDNSGAVDLPS
ncbi:hypothetical protein ACFE04_021755 [Oxalis oulophora]